MAEKVAADASSLHLTAFTSGESEKDSEMQMGAKPIDCIIYGAARENTDVITKISCHVNVNYFF